MSFHYGVNEPIKPIAIRRKDRQWGRVDYAGGCVCMWGGELKSQAQKGGHCLVDTICRIASAESRSVALNVSEH